MQENAQLLKGGQQLILVIDSYAANARYNTLTFLKETNRNVIGIPLQTSHVLQTVDVSIFSAFKLYVSAEFHKFSDKKRLLVHLIFKIFLTYNMMCHILLKI